MAVAFAKASSSDVNGGSLVGYIYASEKALIKKLGAPDTDGDYPKVTREWCVRFEPPDRQPFVCTIYDWKGSPSSADEVYEWHLGGNADRKDISDCIKTAGAALGFSVKIGY